MSFDKLAYFLASFYLALSAKTVWADETPIQPGLNLDTNSMLDSFIGNYMGIDRVGNYLISLSVALILAVIIAFHPQTYGRRKSLSDIEAPKTFIVYAMIGSLVGATVADYGPELGFIFFGLGGLMRFRTNSGTTVQTGRLILVALIGLCCGLKMLYIASLSTLVVWVLIYFLERKTLYHIQIKKLDDKLFPESVAAYRHLLIKQKCKIIVENKNASKSKVEFIFSSPAQLEPEAIEAWLDRQIADANRGVIIWEA